MKPDLITDAVLLAGARGGRNKTHSKRHALRLTLLVHFAFENYPSRGRFEIGLGQTAKLITSIHLQ
jgi:hypothetical protein